MTECKPKPKEIFTMPTADFTRCLVLLDDQRCPAKPTLVRLCTDHYNLQQTALRAGSALWMAEGLNHATRRPHIRTEEDLTALLLHG